MMQNDILSLSLFNTLYLLFLILWFHERDRKKKKESGRSGGRGESKGETPKSQRGKNLHRGWESWIFCLELENDARRNFLTGFPLSNRN